MGIHDRDWYREELRKRSNANRSAPPSPPTWPASPSDEPSKSDWWTRGGAVIACCALVYFAVQTYQLRKQLAEARQVIQQQAQQLQVVQQQKQAPPPRRVEFFNK